jgi:hypothetical protein
VSHEHFCNAFFVGGGSSLMAENTLKPELLAVIRRKSDGKEIVVSSSRVQPVPTPSVAPLAAEIGYRFRDDPHTVLESGLNTLRTDA